VSDSAFEYGGVSPAKLAMWEDLLHDVGFARDPGPSRGRPGHEEAQRLAAQALEQLWTHLALLPRLLDGSHPHVAAYLNSVTRTVEREAPPPPRKRWIDAGLDLSHVMNSLEALLLGLIGPDGQSPHPPRAAELPTPPCFEAWLSLRTGSADLLPGPAARRVVSWRRPRAIVDALQAKEILGRGPRAVSFDDCRALHEKWHPAAPISPDDRGRYDEWQRRFEEVAAQLTADLRVYAERGDCYVGWMAWYGHE